MREVRFVASLPRNEMGKVMRAELGSLDRVARLIKVLGMVNSAADFYDHPQVINGCSELFAAVFGEADGVGEAGAHQRPGDGPKGAPAVSPKRLGRLLHGRADALNDAGKDEVKITYGGETESFDYICIAAGRGIDDPAGQLRESLRERRRGAQRRDRRKRHRDRAAVPGLHLRVQVEARRTRHVRTLARVGELGRSAGRVAGRL